MSKWHLWAHYFVEAAMTLPPNLTAHKKRALAFEDVVALSKVRGFQLVSARNDALDLAHSTQISVDI